MYKHNNKCEQAHENSEGGKQLFLISLSIIIVYC